MDKTQYFSGKQQNNTEMRKFSSYIYELGVSLEKQTPVTEQIISLGGLLPKSDFLTLNFNETGLSYFERLLPKINNS
jgi:hypothetical protein